MQTIHRAALSKAPANPPTEFRLFKAGRNETTKGTFIFDAKAAVSVMAAFRKAGVQLPIDLEHESLDSMPLRADSRDARGWFDLQVRNGDLYAINVSWTPDGQRRLANRSQRYVSPAFKTDADNRVTEIVNVALVAMPATYGAQPVAASKFGARSSGVVSARLTVEDRAAFYRRCAKLGVTAGQVLRDAIVLLANAEKVPAKALAAIATIVGLAPDSDPRAIADAVMALVESVDVPADPSADAPDAPAMLSSSAARARSLARTRAVNAAAAKAFADKYRK